MKESFDRSRRTFIKNSAGLAALAAAGPLADVVPLVAAAQSAGVTPIVGIQIGADSFVDEGTDKVLDILQQKGAVNTLYLSTFTYDRGITGRPAPDKDFPGHGVQESDKNYFHGGNYATPHAPFYTKTAIKGEKLKAPDLGSLDILAEVLPKAKKRGMKVMILRRSICRGERVELCVFFSPMYGNSGSR